MKKSKILIFLLALAVCGSGTAVGVIRKDLTLLYTTGGIFLGSFLGSLTLSTIALPVTFPVACANKIIGEIRKKRGEADTYNSVEHKNAIKRLIKLIEQSNQYDSGTYTYNAHDEKFQNFIAHLLNEHIRSKESFKGPGTTYSWLISLLKRLTKPNASASLREYASRVLPSILPTLLKKLSTDATDKALIEQKKLADYLREIVRIRGIIMRNYGQPYEEITSSMIKHVTWISAAAYLTKKTSNPKHIETLHWAQKNFEHRLKQDLQRLVYALKNDYKDPINDLTGKIKKCQSRIPRININCAMQYPIDCLYGLLIELPAKAALVIALKVTGLDALDQPK